jgi:hypothetical protein
MENRKGTVYVHERSGVRLAKSRRVLHTMTTSVSARSEIRPRNGRRLLT